MSTTEIMELADLYYHNPYREGSHTHLVYADQKRAALLKAVEALAADAARYRWLRATMNWVNSHGQRIDVRNDPELLDASIDGMIAVNAAMKETP